MALIISKFKILRSCIQSAVFSNNKSTELKNDMQVQLLYLKKYHLQKLKWPLCLVSAALRSIVDGPANV